MILKRISFTGLFLSFLLYSNSVFAEVNYPDRPVHIVVYTEPGGLIDVTARKLANLIEKDIKQPVVVENKKGGGGLVALSHVIRRPADGYTIFGLTSSVISKTVAARQEGKLKDLHMLARVVSDYECLIVRKDGAFTDLNSLREHAIKSKQRWVGPAFGGTDHLFAMQTWDTLGMKATWIPYRSGNQALAALLGNHAEVYVGNPHDSDGQPDLKVLAVAAPRRLSQYPDVPTFAELGYKDLSDESLWRGFAVREDTPVELVAKIEKLIKQATETEDWKKFIESGNMVPAFDTGSDFQKIVFNQIEKDKRHFNIQ